VVARCVQAFQYLFLPKHSMAGNAEKSRSKQAIERQIESWLRFAKIQLMIESSARSTQGTYDLIAANGGALPVTVEPESCLTSNAMRALQGHRISACASAEIARSYR